MPAAYAHRNFGKEVYRALPPSISGLIDRYPELFGIGLQGPDILFYYHPSESQAYVLYGHNIHRKPASHFIQFAQSKLNSMEEADRLKGKVYLMGFLCHFMMDSHCHPIVRKNTLPGEISHREIEREFDRYLMEKDGIRPEWFLPWTQTVPLVGKDVAIISGFYPEAGQRAIRRCICNMRLYETLTTAYRMRSRKNLAQCSCQLDRCKESGILPTVAVIQNFLNDDLTAHFPALDQNFG